MNVETQSAYISLANNFYITRLNGKELTELNIIGALLRSAPDYRPDYFRRLRNALAFDQRVRGQFWIAQEINRTLNPVTVLNLPIKAKQSRAKKLSDNDFSALVNALSSQNFVAEAAALLLIYHTGARPCELSGISITGQQIHIPGAKNSHDGLRGADRTLESEQQLCDTVAKSLRVFKCHSRSLDATRMTIRKVAMELFGKRKVPSMYTLRHQFGANLKASGMSRIEMAYVMGHQATDSINRYGDKRQGRAEAVKVKPAVGADLSKIRDTQAVHAQKRHRAPASKQSLLA